MLNCAVDSALGRYERFQETYANQFDAEAEIMRPFVAAMKNIKKAIDDLPITQMDKDTMFCYACTGLHETDFASEQHKNDVNFDEHITGFYALI